MGRRGSNWNVPNALTTLRILLVPVFGWVLLHDGGSDELWRVAAFLVFAFAMVTDKIDGDLARKHDLVTDFGKIADPIADKAITGMAFIGLSVIGALWWWVTVLVLIREWSVTLLRLSVLKHAVMPASQSGKLKTSLQALALGLFILPLRDLGGALAVPGEVLWWVAAAVMGAAVLLTVTSGYEFFRDALAQRKGRATAAKRPTTES
ncbi:MAG: CDP-diacylglycerol--glycerol-3-phosphate 3-phosphatidyltransferase [Nocardioides sp.]|nr:CDP-diacylglycerol--glycerol-3-phosphate 3-phosphatidyltransferase [Nocardioides sp.]